MPTGGQLGVHPPASMLTRAASAICWALKALSTPVYHSLVCVLVMPSVFQVMEEYAGGLKAMKAVKQAQPLSRKELEDVMAQLQDVSVYSFANVCGQSTYSQSATVCHACISISASRHTEFFCSFMQSH